MEKLFALGICFLVWINCSYQAEQKPVSVLTSEKIGIGSKDTAILPMVKFEDHYYFDTTLTVGHSTFRIFRDKDSIYNTYNLRIFKKVGNSWQDNINDEWTSLHEFQDWNKDGYVDIVLQYHHSYEIMFFNPKKEIFVAFGGVGSNDIDDIQDIEGTNLKCNFYEFRTNWYSELFGIDDNYHKVSYGTLVSEEFVKDGVGIDTPIINVYKQLIIYDEAYQNRDIMKDSTKKDKKLIGKMNPIEQKLYMGNSEQSTDRYVAKKLEFVKNYWSKNYQKFIKK